MIAPWDGHRAPMTFLAGYLGSGKTTLLNHLLESVTDRRIAVLVNDVGELNIDASLVAAGDGDTIELTNGCVCCSLVDGFASALDGLRGWIDPPDAVIVELSGVAEPRRVTSWASTPGFRYDATVTLVDVDQVRARAEDRRLTELVDRQIGAADLLVLSKTDLVDDGVLGEVETWISDRSAAPRIAARHGAVSADLVLEIAAPTPSPHPIEASHPPDHRIATVALDEPLTADQATETLASLGPDVVRAKGFARSPSGDLLLLQAVGHRRSVTTHTGDTPPQTGSLVVISLAG